MESEADNFYLPQLQPEPSVLAEHRQRSPQLHVVSAIGTSLISLSVLRDLIYLQKLLLELLLDLWVLGYHHVLDVG